MSAEMTPDPVPRRPGCPLWVRVLLIASLAGNLAVVGLVGGWSMRGGHGYDDPDGLDPRQVRLLRMLPESRHAEARAMMLAERGALASHRERMKAVQADIVSVLRAPDFSAARLQAALDARRAASGAVNGVVHGQFVALVARMSPAERAEMADRLEDLARRWAARQHGR